jgi:hypothetical protein
MANITLQFGKYKGQSLEYIKKFDYEYLVWLAKAGITRQDASKEALDLLGGKAISFANRYSEDEIQQMEEGRESEQAEREAWEEKFAIKWTASSGQLIEICLDKTLSGEYGFSLSVDGKDRFYTATDIKPVSNMPGIVAKIGNVGLTEERRNALRAIWRRRSEWFSPC